jgi:hypothetical protein
MKALATDRKLRGRQELWCQSYALHGNASKAAVAAGYGKSAKQRGWENVRKPELVARVVELTRLRQKAGAPIATNVVEGIAVGKISGPHLDVRLRAATQMQATAGVGPIIESRVTVDGTIEHHLDQAQIDEQIRRIEEIVGYSLRGPVIDVTPVKAETDE